MSYEKLPVEGLVCVSAEIKDDELLIATEDGRKWAIYHPQECCEGVEIDVMCGDVTLLCGEKLSTSCLVKSEYMKTTDQWGEDVLFCFLNLATKKGAVSMIWRGCSNGYYSTDVVCEVRR